MAWVTAQNSVAELMFPQLRVTALPFYLLVQ